MKPKVFQAIEEKKYTASAKENKREEARQGIKESENTNRRQIGTAAKTRPQLEETLDSEPFFQFKKIESEVNIFPNKTQRNNRESKNKN